MELDWLFHRDDTHELWGNEEEFLLPRQGTRHLSRPEDKAHVAAQIGLHADDITMMSLAQETVNLKRTRHQPMAMSVRTVLEVYTVNGNRQGFEVNNINVDWQGITTMEVGIAIPLDPLPF